MNGDLPQYFTRLGPFRGAFGQGAPILTYHKFGPRPPRVRLKGLYLPLPLLEAQLDDLHVSGFVTGPVLEVARSEPGSRRVALTIDDGFRSVLEYALPRLSSQVMTATLYLVSDRLGGWNDWEQAQGEVAAPLMTVGEVREWLAAGQFIGAHTRTHPWLTRLPLAEAREEIHGCRARLEDQFQMPVTDFCYPYGDWNQAVRDLVLEAGFRTAVTTDFGVNPPGTDAWALRRVTARHSSRNWRALVSWFRRRWKAS